MMNKLFRIIKENDNLDALEESDDEEEFESDAVDKFVHLHRKIKLKCLFHRKFKKWFPVELARETDTISSTQDVANFIAHKYNNTSHYTSPHKHTSPHKKYKK
jgi:hypothetical protein